MDGLRVGFFAGPGENARRSSCRSLVAHLVGPPDFGIFELELWKLFGSEADGAGFVGLQRDGLIEPDVADCADEGSGDFCAIRSVVQFSFDGEIRLRRAKSSESA